VIGEKCCWVVWEMDLSWNGSECCWTRREDELQRGEVKKWCNQSPWQNDVTIKPRNDEIGRGHVPGSQSCYRASCPSFAHLLLAVACRKDHPLARLVGYVIIMIPLWDINFHTHSASIPWCRSTARCSATSQKHLRLVAPPLPLPSNSKLSYDSNLITGHALP
jgi:hypothetical protein